MLKIPQPELNSRNLPLSPIQIQLLPISKQRPSQVRLVQSTLLETKPDELPGSEDRFLPGSEESVSGLDEELKEFEVQRRVSVKEIRLGEEVEGD